MEKLNEIGLKDEAQQRLIDAGEHINRGSLDDALCSLLLAEESIRKLIRGAK